MNYLFFIFVPLFLCQTICGPVPRVWDTCNYFRAGSFIFISGQHALINMNDIDNTTFIFPFSSPVPSEVFEATLGIVSWDFFLSNSIQFKFVPLFDKTRIGFSYITLFPNYATSIKFCYLVVDKTFTDHYLLMTSITINMSTNQSLAELPYIWTASINIASTPLNLSHEIVALTFINGAHLESSELNYDLKTYTEISSPTKARFYFLSSSLSMFIYSTRVSVIIFDLTEIELADNYTFYYGSRNAYNSNTSALEVIPPFYYDNGYFYGLANFTLSPGQNRLQFSSEISPSLTTTTSEINFKELSFSFWGVGQKKCPSSDLYLDYADMMCYDPCAEGKYGDDEYLCQLCNSYCKACDSYPKCTSCRSEDNRHLVSDECVPKIGYYDNGVSEAVPCSTTLCEQCPGDTCIECSEGYFLESGSPITCCPCNEIDPKCINCTQNSTVNIVCFECETGYALNSSGLCEEINCIDLNCVECETSADTCTECKEGYFVQNKQCVEESSDDSESGNGNNSQCNNDCKSELGFSCEVEVNISKCYFVGDIEIVPISLNKVEGKNRIEAKIDIGPALYNLTEEELAKIIGIESSTKVDDVKIIKNDDGTITLDFAYHGHIQDKELTFILRPFMLASSVFSRMNETSKNILVIPDNNQLSYFYEEKYYELAGIISLLSSILTYVSLALLVLGLISSKVVVIEMMAVIQVSFFALCSLSNLNPCFAALSSLQFSSGYNMFPNPTQPSKSDLPNQIRVNLVEHFIYNVNFTLISLMLTLLIGFVFFILSKLLKDTEQCRKCLLLSHKFLYEYTFTALAFCSYLISISFVVEMMYGVSNLKSSLTPISLAIAAIMITMTVSYAIVFLMNPKQFGEFSNIFKRNQISSRLYPILILERWIISACLVIAVSSQLSVIGDITTSLLLLVACLITKVHKDKEHTYRFSANMLITTIVLGTYLFYSLSSNEAKSNPINLYLPLVVIVLLFICVLYSAYFIIRSLMNTIQGKKGSEFLETISEDSLTMDQEIETSFKNFNESLNIESNRMNLSFLPESYATTIEPNLTKSNSQQDIRNNNERMKRIKEDLKLQVINPKTSPLKTPIADYEDLGSFTLEKEQDEAI